MACEKSRQRPQTQPCCRNVLSSLAAHKEGGPRPWTELLTCKTSQRNRSLHRNGIILAKQIPQQLIPGSSTESVFGQHEGMQQTWLLFQKYFETVSNKSFTAENGAKGVGGWGLALQSSRKNSLQENWGHSGERAGSRMEGVTSSIPAQRTEWLSPVPPVQCHRSALCQCCSLPCPGDKPPAPKSLCGPGAGQGRSRSSLGTAGFCSLAGLAVSQGPAHPLHCAALPGMCIAKQLAGFPREGVGPGWGNPISPLGLCTARIIWQPRSCVSAVTAAAGSGTRCARDSQGSQCSSGQCSTSGCRNVPRAVPGFAPECSQAAAGCRLGWGRVGTASVHEQSPGSRVQSTRGHGVLGREPAGHDLPHTQGLAGASGHSPCCHPGHPGVTAASH